MPLPIWVEAGFFFPSRSVDSVRTWQYPVQMALFGLGVILFGVAGGCMVGIFVYRRGKGPIWHQVNQRPEDSAVNTGDQDHKTRLHNP
jgi:hypothetical protein